ncbi:hypothetical protein QUF70_17095, partial [Desulfobacterales bacterium HSG17]|nr:hypothetical protein [Desulfobacterales bacterium HSG17]
ILGISIVEWVGYLASVIVAVSLIMNSIIKLRWYNLLGALLFSFYGVLIHSIPVAFLNGLIVLIDAYYLVQLHFKKDRFELLEIPENSVYIEKFLDFHKTEIKNFFPDFTFNYNDYDFRYLILRDMTPAGTVIGNKTKDKTIRLILDYATPMYRDLKTGLYFQTLMAPKFAEEGMRAFEVASVSENHVQYLKRIGFKAIKSSGRGRIFQKPIMS